MTARFDETKSGTHTYKVTQPTSFPHRNFLILIFSFFIALDQGRAQQSTFNSDVDNALSISKILIAPTVDNVDGIYGKPLTEEITNYFKEGQQYDITTLGASQQPIELLSQTEKLKILKANKAQGILVSRVAKGPLGITLTVSLFGGADAELLSVAEKKNLQAFDHKSLAAETRALIKQTLNQLPFHGVLLSRKGNLVTINLGKWAEIGEGTELNVILLLKIQKHPKHGFIIGADREILGRIKVQKTEEYLSFANIEFEKEAGLLRAGMKVIITKMVKYPAPFMSKDGKMIDQIKDRPDAPMVYGDNPVEWKPVSRVPSFGKLGFLGGLTSYAVSNNISGVGAVEKENQFNPTIWLGGEMWVTTDWYMGFDMRQTIATITNTLDSSTPSKLNLSSTYYALNGGYNFLLEDDFWGPKVYIGGGYSRMDTKIDDSTPTAFTSLSWGGLVARIGGSLPVDSGITVGAQMDLFLNTGVSEGPVSSGESSTGTVTNFELYGTKKFDENLQWKGALNYSLYSASFSGTGSRNPSATSASHKLTSLVFGIEYLF